MWQAGEGQAVLNAGRLHSDMSMRAECPAFPPPFTHGVCGEIPEGFGEAGSV